MKKLFLVVLCAGLFFACGNKKQQEPEALMDTVPVEEVIEDVAEEVVEEPVAEEPVAQATPAKKTKIYAYLETLLGKSRSQKELIKEKNRKYENPQHWNLDSEYLEPLKEFILNCL